MRISDWSSDVCSSDLCPERRPAPWRRRSRPSGSDRESPGAQAWRSAPSNNFPAGVIDDAFPIFLGESTTLRCRKDIEDCFSGAAELNTERRNHQRPVDEDREFNHRTDQDTFTMTLTATPKDGRGR